MVESAAALGAAAPSPAPEAAGLDVVVRGAGIVGRTLALALARRGWRVALQADATRQAAQHQDLRAYSINAASQALLDAVGAWARLPAQACTPVHEMRVVGDARAQAIDFSAWQQRVRELAWIVDAGALEAALDEAVDAGGAIRRVGMADAPPAHRLLAVAEGKSSATRQALGASFDRQPYGQHALAARLVSDVAHAHTARQWFLAPDILALLPFDSPEPGRSFALVWSLPPERAQALQAMDAAAFERELNDATQGEAGRLSLRGERALWPLAIGRADRVAGPGWVLLGDAAHQVHPLAGQGVNLGLGDVAALLAVIDAKEPWRELDDERLLARYARQRAWPVAAMSGVTDALQWLFAHPSPMARELRNRGLGLVDRLAPVKRWLAGEALGR